MLTINNNDFQKLINFIRKKYGLNLKDKKILVESRLNNYILDCGFSDFSDYLTVVYCDASGREMANLINRLTTNHTYFMRETEHFDHFSNVFLPNAENHIADHDLRIWSAGCSYGNEPYNLAMCLDEYFGSHINEWNTQILATDISFNALRSAMRGIYPEQDLEKIPEKWREKYFVKMHNGLYQVTDSIRKNVVFKYHNLMDDINFKKKFDLILCRNVMIYFDEETKEQLCKRFYDATENGGYLYIGHAESEPIDMKYIKENPAVYRKHEVKD